jgi:hypothetical protein
VSDVEAGGRIITSGKRTAANAMYSHDVLSHCHCGRSVYIIRILLLLLSCCRDACPGHLLCSKLLSYMRPKMHGLLLDTSINSQATVRLNIYQVRASWWHQFIVIIIVTNCGN